MNQLTIILLTAAYRWNGLIHIAKSIYESAVQNPDIRLHWVICKDHNRGFGDFDSAIKYCMNKNLLFTVVNAGKSEEELDRTVPRPGNYGGDMYNEPLKQVLSEYYSDQDPWVYILDDDNLLHPLLARFVKRVSAVEPNKRIIWSCKIRGTGIVDDADEFASLSTIEARLSTGYYGPVIPMLFSPDPSQMILKSSIIIENGYYNAQADYDYTWMVPLCQNNRDEIIYPTSINRWCLDQVQSYWNGMRTMEDVETDLGYLHDQSKLTAGHFYFESDDTNDHPRIYPLPDEVQEQLFEHMKMNPEFFKIRL